MEMQAPHQQGHAGWDAVTGATKMQQRTPEEEAKIKEYQSRVEDVGKAMDRLFATPDGKKVLDYLNRWSHMAGLFDFGSANCALQAANNSGKREMTEHIHNLIGISREGIPNVG